MRPLTLASRGETGSVVKITGNDHVRRHLADLGFVAGAQVSVISELAGGLILSLGGAGGSRLALDKDMANRIMI